MIMELIDFVTIKYTTETPARDKKLLDTNNSMFNVSPCLTVVSWCCLHRYGQSPVLQEHMKTSARPELNH